MDFATLEDGQIQLEHAHTWLNSRQRAHPVMFAGEAHAAHDALRVVLLLLKRKGGSGLGGSDVLPASETVRQP